MKDIRDNLFPIFSDILKKKDKEKLLNQNAKAIWITGLSGSGKTTIALQLEQHLHSHGILCQILDGDNIRVGISKNLSFSSEDRSENIRRVAEITKLFINCGVVTINCFISPTNKIRKIAKDIIEDKNFVEIFIDASVETCEDRDVKGLYKKAKAGEIIDFTGVNSPFEAPEKPDLIINTSELTITESVNRAIKYILPQIKKATNELL